MRRAVVIASLLLSFAAAAQEPIDLSVINRIKTEALTRTRVMDHAFYLTDVSGPRLTGSPNFVNAATWVEGRLKEYGLVDIRREPFTWGRGWVADRYRAEIVAPHFAPLPGYPLPWSPATNGPLDAEAILAPFPDYKDWSEASFKQYFDTYKGKLRGKIVLVEALRPVKLEAVTPEKRFTPQELEEHRQLWIGNEQYADGRPSVPGKPFKYYAEELVKFYNKEGAALLVFQDWGNGGGMIMLSHALGSNWLHYPDSQLPPPMAGVALEHYNKVGRLLIRNIPVRLAFEIRTRTDPNSTFNLTAEIRGTDKSDEVVMIGAHLDSWTAGTGATDNAAGVSVMMEAMRIIKALDLKPRRTIRLALWGGHEGEGLGVRNYLKDHFGTRDNPKVEYGKMSIYFNLDNGTGRIRGIYANQNEKIFPVFQRWFEPFETMGASVVSVNIMTGTDHWAFEEIGLPGFQFIQDPMDYKITHHSSLDLYDYLKEGDLKQASAVIAAFAWLAATRDELMPRK